jgi:Fungal Zn(2)-Cys(6) binuclear cluster domain/Fungal specific transcription factor domain
MDKRVRTGCSTCRKRRVKCDEGKPVCRRCRNANFHCEGYEQPQRLSSTPLISAASPTQDTHSLLTTHSSEPSWRHVRWRQEQLPLFHHFVTVTVPRLFRGDHVSFWRDQAAQMSYGVDLVYEALLAIGAVHRAKLLGCSDITVAEASRCKIHGLQAYGRALQLLPSFLNREGTELFSALIALSMLTYFEVPFDL